MIIVFKLNFFKCSEPFVTEKIYYHNNDQRRSNDNYLGEFKWFY